jgi:hypothetical protein
MFQKASISGIGIYDDFLIVGESTSDSIHLFDLRYV